MNRSHVTGLLALSFVVSIGGSFLACGSSKGGGGGGGGGPDSGMDTGATQGDSSVTGTDGRAPDTGTGVDTGTPGQDSGTSSGGDSGMGGQDGAACTVAMGSGTCPGTGGTLPGTELAAGAGSTLFGVTTDGYAVYMDSCGTAWAADITGANKPVQIATGLAVQTSSGSPSAQITVSNKAAFIWYSVPSCGSSPCAQTSKLGVWTKASGYHDATMVAVFPYAASDADGKAVVYNTNVNSTDTVADFVVSPADFSSSPVTIATGAGTNQTTGTCLPSVDSVGPAGSSTVLVGVCITNDAGPGGTLFAVNPSTMAVAQIQATTGTSSTAVFYTADSAGTHVFLGTKAGAGVVVPTGGGSATTVDTNVFGGQMLTDGSKVVYGLNDTTFKVTSTTTACTTGCGTVLVAADAGTCGTGANAKPCGMPGFFTGAGAGLAPGNGHVLGFRNQASSGAVDLYAVSTSTPNQTPLALASSPTAYLFGSGWTADGQYALYISPVNLSTGYGTLDYANVSTGTIKSMQATSVWLDWALGTAGEKVTYNDNGVPNSNNQLRGTADIEVIDLSQATPTPTKLVPGADVNYYPSPDGTKLVYTYTACSAAGVYVVPVP